MAKSCKAIATIGTVSMGNVKAQTSQEWHRREMAYHRYATTNESKGFELNRTAKDKQRLETHSKGKE